ncbi:MAG: amino acid permease [bacterium]
MKRLLRKKAIASIAATEAGENSGLKRSLSAFDLTCLGIGAIIGVGIFVVTGTAAARFAGPAIAISFILSMFACGCAALCYAECASIIPLAGSAYNYSYAALGEIFGWLAGWALVLEYSVATVLVAVGWSGYFVHILKTVGIELPVWCSAAPGSVPGAVINLPAAGIVLLLSGLLLKGVKKSARFTTLLVFIKIVAVLIFIAIGCSHINTANWTPFMPFGAGGIVSGAAIVFVAYLGFDMLSSMAEETKNPQRNMPIGILASLFICTVLYIAVSLILTGVVNYTELDNPAPVAYALSSIGFKWGAAIVSTGAITGLTSVLLVLLMSQPRIFFAMSRDGLISPWISKVHPKYNMPHRAQIFCALIIAFFSAFVDVGTAAELTNIGTLTAFVLVSAAVLVFRYTKPDLHRPFRCPLVPYIPVMGMAICLWLMANLARITWICFGIWCVLGFVIYFAYGRRRSLLAAQAPA